jgi:hypothetical protein
MMKNSMLNFVLASSNYEIIYFSVLLNIDMTTSLIRRDLGVHAGKNITIPCVRNSDVMWSREGFNITYNVNVSGV